MYIINIYIYNQNFRRINTENAENAANRISERLKFKISRGGACPRTPLATPACLSWPFGLTTALYILTYPTGDGTAILRGPPSHAKV